MKKLSKEEFIRKMASIKNVESKNTNKWGTKANTKAIRW